MQLLSIALLLSLASAAPQGQAPGTSNTCNILRNGGFEESAPSTNSWVATATQPPGWSAYQRNTQNAGLFEYDRTTPGGPWASKEGVFSTDLASNYPLDLVSDSFKLDGTSTYDVSFFLYANLCGAASKTGKLAVIGDNGAQLATLVFTYSSGQAWTQRSVQFNSASYANAKSAQLKFTYTGEGSCGVVIDDVKVIPSVCPPASCPSILTNGGFEQNGAAVCGTNGWIGTMTHPTGWKAYVRGTKTLGKFEYDKTNSKGGPWAAKEGDFSTDLASDYPLDLLSDAFTLDGTSTYDVSFFNFANLCGAASKTGKLAVIGDNGSTIAELNFEYNSGQPQWTQRTLQITPSIYGAAKSAQLKFTDLNNNSCGVVIDDVKVIPSDCSTINVTKKYEKKKCVKKAA